MIYVHGGFPNIVSPKELQRQSLRKLRVALAAGLMPRRTKLHKPYPPVIKLGLLEDPPFYRRFSTGFPLVFPLCSSDVGP